MKKYFHEERKENHDPKSNENLAAAYNILRDLSDDEFESWLEGGDATPAEYVEAERKFLAQPISEKIADLKRRAALKAQPSSPKVGLVKRLKDAFCEFSELGSLSVESVAVVYCSDPEALPPEQQPMNLCEWFEEDELNNKLSWATHTVIIMKSPIKDKPGMVRYRALIEKRKDGCGGGALCIALQAGEHTDKVRLEPDLPSKTFLKTVLPADAPVSFAPILE
jgi:hypothetical protein